MVQNGIFWNSHSKDTINQGSHPPVGGGVSNNATLLVSVIRHGGYKTDDLLHLKLKKFKIRSYKAKNKIL